MCRPTDNPDSVLRPALAVPPELAEPLQISVPRPNSEHEKVWNSKL